MDIGYKNKKLKRIFDSLEALRGAYGQNGDVIKSRMGFLKAVECLNDVPVMKPTRRHQLSGDRESQFAVDLKHPFRLIFCPAHDPLPYKEDGGIDLIRVRTITILGVEDYH